MVVKKDEYFHIVANASNHLFGLTKATPGKRLQLQTMENVNNDKSNKIETRFQLVLTKCECPNSYVAFSIISDENNNMLSVMDNKLNDIM